MDQSPSIFESFNARNLAPTQVAKTFVPQEQYSKLAKRCHSMLIGPRGSGKTTLLKMLQPQALEVWEHTRAQEFRSRVDFSGVFIASDVSWGRQREAIGDGKLDESTHEQVSRALFTTHVLKALVNCMIFRTSAQPASASNQFRRANISLDRETQLVTALSAAWHVKPDLPSLFALRIALYRRQSEIRELAGREVTLGIEGRPDRLASLPFLFLHFVDAVSIATNAFNDFSNESDAKWALLFDELELAPKWIVDQLILAVRSVDDTLLFKLAMSPVSSYEYPEALKQVAGPAPGQDYEPIPLWYVEKHEPYLFCEALWNRMLAERELPPNSPNEVLGESYSEFSKEAKRIGQSAYQSNARIARSFRDLAKRDSTFRQYLHTKAIDPERLDQVLPKKGDEIVRKIAPLVLFREYFRGHELKAAAQATKRSRKVAEIYGGAESLFAITEGNPRWFIGMLGVLFEKLDPENMKISPQQQARAVEVTAERFVALLRTIPTAIPKVRGQPISIDSIVRRIGEFFEDRAIVAPFVAEPPATFRVPPIIDKDLRSSLDKALNAGAFVYIPDEGAELFLRSISGKRFRLSYLLAPLYHLPLRLGTEASLSSILLGNANDGPKSGDLLDGLRG